MEKSGRKSYDVHFWLGNESSTDEKGGAALLTVELDDLLGGRPVQHREVEGHESNLFMSYFKDGVRYMTGGVASGFRSVEPDAYEPRLLHLKGKRKVRAIPVELSWRSLNEGDVFILDHGLTIFQYNGKDSSRKERGRALQLTVRIRDRERGARARILIVDSENSHDVPEEDMGEFWKLLGGPLGPGEAIASADEAGDDAEFERATAENIVLYQVSDASGSMKVEEVSRPPLHKADLLTEDAFVLDCGAEIFVWVGAGATKEERKDSMAIAEKFLAESDRPVYTPITRIVERGETPLFKAYFSDWYAEEQKELKLNFSAKGSSAGSSSSGPDGSGAAPAEPAVDVAALRDAAREYEEHVVDDGSGTKRVFRIENYNLVLVDEALHGQFFAGDCYCIEYTYRTKSGREEIIIYYWQGRDSSQDERGSSALRAKELDSQTEIPATQVRVVQGKEPFHFLNLFPAGVVIREGGIASGFTNVNDQDVYDTEDSVQLFHVRGTRPENVHAVQVTPSATSLNSNDAFILDAPHHQYVWIGRGASESERERAVSIASLVSRVERDSVIVTEADEPAEFWELLGGKEEYASYEHLIDVPVEARLFWCSNASGTFKAEEILNFAQEDMRDDDVFILDTYLEVFVWIGSEANDVERKSAAKLAVEYVTTATDGRDPDQPILVIQSGHEPSLFTCHFHAWDYEHASTLSHSYEDTLAQIGAGRVVGSRAADEAGSSAPPPSSSAPEPLDARDMLAAAANVEIHPYSALKKRPPPAGCDPAALEQHLSEEEFTKVFKMDRAAFDALPQWKKLAAKKKAKLF